MWTAEEQAAARKFYEEVADLAQGSGVAVSILTVEGQECRLEELCAVVDRTGGDVERVNPLTASSAGLKFISFFILLQKRALVYALQTVLC